MSDFQQRINNLKHFFNKIINKKSVFDENRDNIPAETKEKRSVVDENGMIKKYSLIDSTLRETLTNQILTAKATTMGGWHTFEQLRVILPAQLRPIQKPKKKRTQREKAAEVIKQV